MSTSHKIVSGHATHPYQLYVATMAVKRTEGWKAPCDPKRDHLLRPVNPSEFRPHLCMPWDSHGTHCLGFTLCLTFWAFVPFDPAPFEANTQRRRDRVEDAIPSAPPKGRPSRWSSPPSPPGSSGRSPPGSVLPPSQNDRFGSVHTSLGTPWHMNNGIVLHMNMNNVYKTMCKTMPL